MFEVGVSHTASARSVDSERRRPSDGRLRRERAGADGQQCERDRAHRVLRLAGQSSNGGASGSLLGRTQGARHFTPAKRRLPAAWLEPLSSRYQKKVRAAAARREGRRNRDAAAPAVQARARERTGHFRDAQPGRSRIGRGRRHRLRTREAARGAVDAAARRRMIDPRGSVATAEPYTKSFLLIF